MPLTAGKTTPPPSPTRPRAGRHAPPSSTAPIAARWSPPVRTTSAPSNGNATPCACGGGCPRCGVSASLDPALRNNLEKSTGASLSSVRLHHDHASGLRSIREGAAAFTLGSDIFFAPGHYQPETPQGRHLITHEIGHVLQQTQTPETAGTADHSRSEREAEAFASSVQNGADVSSASLHHSPRRPQRTELEADAMRARMTEIETLIEPISSSADGNASLSADEYYALQQEYNELQLRLQRVSASPAPRTTATEPPASASSCSMEEPVLDTPETWPVCEPEPSAAGEPYGPELPPRAPVAEPEAIMTDPPEILSLPRTAPVCEAPPETAMTPGEMVDYIVTQRGFSSVGPSEEGGMGVPSFERGPLGPGYETNAIIQIVDAEGNVVAAEVAQYSGGSAHAEAQAVARLRARLGGRMIPGGRITVAVDQVACPECFSSIRALAEELGLSEFAVWGPSRTTPGGRTVSPKWASRTATTPPARPSAAEPPPATYRVEPRLMQGETIAPPAAAIETPMVTPEAPMTPRASTPPPESMPMADPPERIGPVEPSAPESTRPGGGWGGAAMAIAPLALGFFHSWAESHRMAEQVETEGYAPVGPRAYADLDLASRLGTWLLDPFLGSMTPPSQRFHLPTWRAHVREELAGRDRVTFSWEMSRPDDPMGHILPDYVDVEYQRGPDGSWQIVPGQSLPEGFDPPDLNLIVNPDVSDSAVELDACIRAGTCA
jgi:hypothetical protein